MTWRRQILLSASVFTLMLISCHYSFTGASIAPEVKTISIDYFKSYAPLAPPNLEQVFTETLRDVFVSQTSLRLIEHGGDIRFEGKITGYQPGQPVSVGQTQTADKERLTITVRVKFTDTNNPKNNFDRSFSRFQDYDATQALSSVEDELIEDINQQLAQNIFDASLSNW